MKNFARVLFIALLLPLLLAILHPSIRKHLLRPTRNFAGHGLFFNRFAVRRGRSSVLPLWAEIVYHAWVRPIRVYDEAVRNRFFTHG